VARQAGREGKQRAAGSGSGLAKQLHDTGRKIGCGSW